MAGLGADTFFLPSTFCNSTSTNILVPAVFFGIYEFYDAFLTVNVGRNMPPSSFGMVEDETVLGPNTKLKIRITGDVIDISKAYTKNGALTAGLIPGQYFSKTTIDSRSINSLGSTLAAGRILGTALDTKNLIFNVMQTYRGF